MQIKVMSWNTFLGYDIDGVVEHIFQENPDIVGLQEIVEGYPTAQIPNTAYLIRDKLSQRGQIYEAVYFPAFKSDRHATHHEIGNAVLSLFPISKKKRHFLSDLKMYENRDKDTVARDAEPRIAVETYLDLKGGRLRIINTHLGVSQNRKPTKYSDIQVKGLVKLIGSGRNTILMGDFNITPDSEYIKRISTILKNTDKKQLPSWPVIKEGVLTHHKPYGKAILKAKLLTDRLDQIFIGEGIQVVDFYLGNSTASDHKSLITKLEL